MKRSRSLSHLQFNNQPCYNPSYELAHSVMPMALAVYLCCTQLSQDTPLLHLSPINNSTTSHNIAPHTGYRVGSLSHANGTSSISLFRSALQRYSSPLLHLSPINNSTTSHNITPHTGFRVGSLTRANGTGSISLFRSVLQRYSSVGRSAPDLSPPDELFIVVSYATSEKPKMSLASFSSSHGFAAY